MNIKIWLIRRVVRFLFRQISFDISRIPPLADVESRKAQWNEFGNLNLVRNDMKRWITQLHNQSLKYTDPRTLAMITGQLLVLARILNYKVIKKSKSRANYAAYEKKMDSSEKKGEDLVIPSK